MPGKPWRQRLEPDAVWRAIDRARHAEPSAIAERRELRAAVRFLRDQLDAFHYSNRGANWSAHRLTEALLELLFELDAIDLRGVAELVSNPRRRQAFRRKREQFQVRPPRAASER